MSSLAGKISLITGGAQGLGKAFCEALLNKGARVCVADVNESLAKETAESFTKTFGKESAAFVKCDVCSQQEMENAFTFTKKTFGGLDIVCNNAGIADERIWERVIQINLIGVVRGTLLAIEHMNKENGGRGGIIVNTASLAGLMSVHNSPAYCAAKHGVVALTRSWAKNPACEKMGLRFHALCPAFAQTAIISTEEGKLYDAASTGKALQLYGMMSPEAVAEAFLELVQCDSSSGEVLAVTQEHGISWMKETQLSLSQL